jgi:uncharacterized protein YqhQ
MAEDPAQAQQQPDQQCCPEKHFYGGQAVIEGVMMLGLDRYAVAVRRSDGEVVIGEKPFARFGDRHPWAKWPFIRGNIGLVETVALGFGALQFSADVMAQEENERNAAESEKAGGEPAKPQAGVGPVLMTLTTVVATAFALGLFVVLPTWVVDWLMGKGGGQISYGASVVRNLVEGLIRLAVICLYILTISLMKYVRRVFEYHGAEHATINCFERGEPVTRENAVRYSPLHPRCGTSFLLVVILVKIIVGCFFGWPAPWLRSVIRLALLPIVAGIAYEVIRWAGRHRDSMFSKVLAAPGMLMQVLTTRKPSEEQVDVAIYALAAVADEVELPEGWPQARRLPIPLVAQDRQEAAEPQPPESG